MTETIYKAHPNIKIGLLPTISAALGRTKEPEKVPIKKHEPIYPNVDSEAHYKLYCKIQLCRDLLEVQSTSYNTAGFIFPGIAVQISSLVQLVLSTEPTLMQV